LGANVTCETQMFDPSRQMPFAHSLPVVQGDPSGSVASQVLAVEHFSISLQGRPSLHGSPRPPLMSQCFDTPQW
jgi:hypothetical protein